MLTQLKMLRFYCEKPKMSPPTTDIRRDYGTQLIIYRKLKRLSAALPAQYKIIQSAFAETSCRHKRVSEIKYSSIIGSTSFRLPCQASETFTFMLLLFFFVIFNKENLLWILVTLLPGAYNRCQHLMLDHNKKCNWRIKTEINFLLIPFCWADK